MPRSILPSSGHRAVFSVAWPVGSEDDGSNHGGRLPLRPPRGTVTPTAKHIPRAISVTLILASRPNVYSSSPLDRAGARREEADWIEQRLHDPETLFVPVWRNRNLVRGMDEGAPEAVFISGEVAHTLRMHGGPWAFLGMHGEQAVFAVDISTAD